MSKHTAGKWKVGGKDKTIVYAGDGHAVASCAVYHGRFKDGESEANSRLISAAPELFSLAKESADMLERIMLNDDWGAIEEHIQDLRAAIAKATGKTE